MTLTDISIHALRVEGDSSTFRSHQPHIRFLSTPSGWRATGAKVEISYNGQFLSTPSGWRATDHHTIIPHALRFLSTPSGWRATEVGFHRDVRQAVFLSTPSGWRATSNTQTSARRLRFLSTPSGWRATSAFAFACWRSSISIHALRVEGDVV